MARDMAEYGGLDEDFVNEIKDTLICHICTKPLRDPHLSVAATIFASPAWSNGPKNTESNVARFVAALGKIFNTFPIKRRKGRSTR